VCTTDVKERLSMQWVDDIKEKILMAPIGWRTNGYSDDDSARWRLGCGGRTHIVLEIRVCASSDEVAHNLRVELAGGVRGIVKRSPSEMQQKKKKETRNF
jgi:hypothetical protein